MGVSTGGGAQTSAPMLEVNPLTSEMLQDARPAEKKRLIGERLFPKIQVVEPRLAGKITGMLLEMDNTELLVLLSEQRALTKTITTKSWINQKSIFTKSRCWLCSKLILL